MKKITFLPALVISGFGANLSMSAAELPNPHLFVTTKAIHEIIAAKPIPEHTAYTETVPLAKDATFDLLPIPGGTFKIGSPENESSRNQNEGPQREIKIEPFWMAKLEVTWDLYRPFMYNGAPRNKDGTLNRDSNLYTSNPPEILEGETLIDTITQPTPPHRPMHFEMGDGYSREFPAIAVTFHAANKFCEWLSAQTGHFYRLPTEAEWEYAARAGTTTAYHFGDDPAKLGEYAWFAENSNFQYQKVGTKKPNPWGLHDMLGNVAELTLDYYLPDAYAKIEDGATNPWQPSPDRHPTVFRGGHWDQDADKLRSAARVGTSTELKKTDPQIPKSIWYYTDTLWLGFRIVRPTTIPTAEEMHRYWNQGPGENE